MDKRFGLLVGLLVLLTLVPLIGSACGTDGTFQNTAPTSSGSVFTPSQDVARAGLASPAATSPDVSPSLMNHVKKGQPYAVFRKQLLANGWQPVTTAMCMANVVGDNYKTLCAESPDLEGCHLCEHMPELNTCSGDGYCTMQFRHVATPEIIQVTTYGDTNGWPNPDIIVTDWIFTKTPDK